MTKSLVAICGKSCSGKDTLARELAAAIPNSHLVVSDTSRPPRPQEVDGMAYHFRDKAKCMEESLYRGIYLEHTIFRGWFYGTRYDELQENKINIGVFNPAGVRSLRSAAGINVVPILCEVPFGERMRRARKRDGISLETLRRGVTDERDFRGFDRVLNGFAFSALFTPSSVVERYAAYVQDAVFSLEKGTR